MGRWHISILPFAFCSCHWESLRLPPQPSGWRVSPNMSQREGRTRLANISSGPADSALSGHSHRRRISHHGRGHLRRALPTGRVRRRGDSEHRARPGVLFAWAARDGRDPRGHSNFLRTQRHADSNNLRRRRGRGQLIWHLLALTAVGFFGIGALGWNVSSSASLDPLIHRHPTVRSDGIRRDRRAHPGVCRSRYYRGRRCIVRPRNGVVQFHPHRKNCPNRGRARTGGSTLSFTNLVAWLSGARRSSEGIADGQSKVEHSLTK
jgi:hypothetical protein